MSITPQMVQKLRETSGAGIMDCKKALEESAGDFEKAIQFLREKGKATAAKRAGRATGQGVVCCWVSPDGRKGSIVEIDCETDFVARTKEVNDFAQALALEVAEHSLPSVEALLKKNLGASRDSVEVLLKEKIGKIGENILIRRVGHLGNGGRENALVGHYVHAAYEPGAPCGTLGVLVEVQATKDDPEIRQLMRELCMQVAAASPKWIRREDVPRDVIEKEQAIYKEQCRQSGKPEKAWDRIMEGKLNDFYRQFCLLDQPHVRDSSGKSSVQSLLQAAQSKVGATISVRNFFRFKVGEE